MLRGCRAATPGGSCDRDGAGQRERRAEGRVIGRRRRARTPVAGRPFPPAAAPHPVAASVADAATCARATPPTRLTNHPVQSQHRTHQKHASCRSHATGTPQCPKPRRRSFIKALPRTLVGTSSRPLLPPEHIFMAAIPLPPDAPN